MLTRTLGVYRAVFDDVGVSSGPANAPSPTWCRRPTAAPSAPPTPRGANPDPWLRASPPCATAPASWSALADMPFVAVATLRALLAEMTAHPRRHRQTPA